MNSDTPSTALLRLPQVLARFPVSRSKWYAGVKNGLYPEPIRLGSRCAMWKAADIDRLIEDVSKCQR